MINYIGNKRILRSIICIVLIINISCKNSDPKKDKLVSKEGMVFIPGGNFDMGGDNEEARSDEFPKHQVTVSSFWMDIAEVTNSQFKKFVDATGYITTAERKIDWDEISIMLPPDTPKPHDSLLSPASLVFKEVSTSNLNDYSKWWSLVKGANWKQPFGPGSDIIGKENFPVVHVSWEDANAYCEWSGKRLPTEAEFEFASRAGKINSVYTWGNEKVDNGVLKANTWDGEFPKKNTIKDKFYYAAPVKSFKPNNYGLYDLAGNVWEWCSDWYHANYYSMLPKQGSVDPIGPDSSYDPVEPFSEKKVIRGGSFLCNDSYCSGYRNAARMKTTPDSSSLHTGFRTVVSAD
jgi:formylglycine-generating enzyme required for sulfatase activity